MSSSWMAEGGVGVNWQFGETLREVNSDKWTHPHNIHRWPAKDEDNRITQDNREDKDEDNNLYLKMKMFFWLDQKDEDGRVKMFSL